MIQKKIRSLIFAGLGLVLCVLLCGGIGMTAQAESYGNLTYEENESGITITGYTGNKTKLVIPEKIKRKKVICIRSEAFANCSSLKSITIPEGVKWIERFAFSGCSGLTSITIPESVTLIGGGAFSGCSNLTNIIVDKKYDSRSNCNAIIETESNSLIVGCKNTIIPEGVTWIYEFAFSGCSDLKSITIPESVTSIGYSIFSGCSSLTSIMIPKGVTSITVGAFINCNSLTSITVDKENKKYDSRSNCNAIIETGSNILIAGCKNTIIPEGVTGIECYAFKGCSSLKSITIPDSVTWIGDYAFYGCSSLTSITIPKSVTYIGEDAFNSNIVISCYKDSAAYNYAKQNNIPVKLIVDPAKKGTILTVSSKKLEVMVTSSSKKNPTVTVTKITDKKAKKLTIPATVKVKGATYKVTAISDRAFKGNKKLTTVTIGSNVTTIGIGAFYGCKNLKKITVTAGKLTTINRSVFKGIKKNATITVKGTKKAKTALKKQLKKKSIGYVKTWKIK